MNRERCWSVIRYSCLKGKGNKRTQSSRSLRPLHCTLHVCGGGGSEILKHQLAWLMVYVQFRISGSDGTSDSNKQRDLFQACSRKSRSAVVPFGGRVR